MTLNKYEKLLDESTKDKVEVIDYKFNSDKIKGLYCDRTIALSKGLNTTSEKISILAEELGHHYTTVGNIIDQTNVLNRKQELRARLWAYNKMIGLTGIIRAYENGCRNHYEMADYLEVTESFLLEAIECYKTKYGLYAQIDNYAIYFEPLGVLKINL